MRNDIHELKKKTFDYAILDESHTVRNPASKTFKALKWIKANNRLCMSGTPVQNTTMDLWTQFQFLNPGLPGNQKQFREQWVKPVEEKILRLQARKKDLADKLIVAESGIFKELKRDDLLALFE